MNVETPPSVPQTRIPSARILHVEPAEAFVATLAAGVWGALMAYGLRKLHWSPEVLTGACVFIGSGAMAIWHQIR